ncbi:beta-ketoacyl-ACP synthase III [Aestuariirhabdus litorea]|uniref:Beta-ketoacyl-ACP synthase III n=1 Tax=Aestuariirhabdus litorea TaxID=2528527 RepID=A0A3P3VT23_9GAMM|nr:beta-ketoacyl-ACP synthase III [Aestuariirhabdus litorea]RRJ85467.1 beta-ketoacyl-ACP synthase III [Aestuariirhabdus litorea]RWW98065.1 beta-ketoacyl-ACP synthase III [Endozoicomonadaceae bacterium GTF-13]
MTEVVISGTGLYTPSASISNEELVESFNAYVKRFNEQHRLEIEAGEREPMAESSAPFIEKASGIRSRYVMDKSGILDIDRMTPFLPERSNEELSVQAEMAVAAAHEALRRAGRTAAEVDAVICAASNMQRAYPAMAIEIQNALGAGGYAYDMNVACSSATFGLQAAVDALRGGSANVVLMVNPEICSGHLNFADRDSHFIFGDVATAVVVERKDTAVSDHQFEVLGCKLQTQFSNNIRNNFGFLNRADERGVGARDKLFVQNGRKVFKDVCPMVAQQITDHIDELGVSVEELKRLWLHQANINMNSLVARKVLGRDPAPEEAPIILDEYANTSSAGSIIAFHKYQDDIESGATGVICSFGAGYSIGSVVVRKI